MTKKKKYTPQQKAIIRRYYAEKAQRTKLHEGVPKVNSGRFKLPLKKGKHLWNVYRVSNSILNGKHDNDVHGGLVLDELNDKVLLVEVTHSKKNGKRNNMKIRNLRSGDLDENGVLRESYLRKKLIVSVNTVRGEEPIDVIALQRQMNDLNFTEQEKQSIIDELSNLSTAEGKYKKFVDLANKKE